MTGIYIVCPYCLAPIPVSFSLPSTDDITIEGTRSALRPGRVVVTYRPKYVVVHVCQTPKEPT